MKTILLTLLTIMTGQMFAQSAATWNDLFTGNIMGVDCNLKGTHKADQWTAQINAQGYIYNLSGTITGQEFKGTLSDPITNGSLPCAGTLSGTNLTLRLQENSESFELVFTKASTATVPSPNPVKKGNIDQRLVGQWRYTDTYVSGEFSFATDYHMSLFADGTMTYREGRTAGGGPDASIDSGDSENTQLQWKAEGQIVYVNGGQGWEYLAKYAVDNANLLMTYQNGSKKIWERL